MQPTTAKRTRVPLAAIVAIERTDLAAHALGIRLSAAAPSSRPTHNNMTSANGKTTTLSLAFATDAALYDWQDDLYARSPLGRYTSGPFDFVHKAHVGADVAGNFGVSFVVSLWLFSVSSVCFSVCSRFFLRFFVVFLSFFAISIL